VQRLGGQFVLRIDDTDENRNRPEALQPILDGFRWLGMNWDEGPEVGGPYGPYFQSERGHLYKAAAMKLLETGHAYPDYTTAEERATEKARIDATKKPYVFRGEHRNVSIADCMRMYQEKPTTLRFKIPSGHKVIIDDLIRGRCEQDSELLTDLPILREDGSALYNFATVIDEHELKITHVLRAHEHLPNTYPQKLIYEALGYPVPRFGHVPLVNYKGKKMSKRNLPPPTEDERAIFRRLGWTDAEIDSSGINLAMVAYYRELGYLPEAVINYLGRLGWSLDDHTEFLRLKDFIAAFDFETGTGRINKAPAEFDPKKLFWLQGEYMNLLSVEEKVKGSLPFLQRAKILPENPTPKQMATLDAIVKASAERLKLFSTILEYAAPIFADPVYNPKSVEKGLKAAGAVELLQEFAKVLETCEPFDAATTDKALHTFCESKGIKAGVLVKPVRVATTGVDVGFGLFETLAILGKAEVLRRIDMAVKLV
jgi:nondiscriminating glutamyl-tRNA synthetase